MSETPGIIASARSGPGTALRLLIPESIIVSFFYRGPTGALRPRLRANVRFLQRGR